jgi:hypothetical protein
MSTITLDMLTTMIADARPELSAHEAGLVLADTIVSIDNAYEAERVQALVQAPVQRTPKAPKAATKVKAAYVQATVAERKARYVGAFWAGKASKSQVSRIVKFAASNGFEPFTSAELRDMTAIDAAEWLVFMNCEVAGLTYAPIA